MKVLIGADLVPTKSNFDFFKSGSINKLICDDLKAILESVDYRIFNLEVPLTNNEEPISKNGPNLIAPVECIKGIKALGVDLLTIANNHILDQGNQGLYSTMKVLDANNISYLGAGENISFARKTFVLPFENKKIGIYACAEHEFTIASEGSAGANPFDALESPDDIRSLKSKCDYVIVLYHGGKEYYRYPSPDLQKRCRKMIESGADLVVCQHSHCIGCEEKYHNGTIVYGQGNFLFDAADDEYWENSLLIEIDFENDAIKYIPICKDGSSVRVADEDEKRKILGGFETRSNQIKDTNHIKETYSEFSNKMLNTYIGGIYGTNIIFRIINKLCGHKLKRKLSDKKKKCLINFLECEAHRELLTEALKNSMTCGEKK